MTEIILYQIGKNGLNENSVNDVISFLKKKKTVKVRFMRSALGEKTRFELADELISKIPFDVKKKLVGNVLDISKKQNI